MGSLYLEALGCVPLLLENLFGLLDIYPVPYLLGISLPLHLVYIAVFGMAFLYSSSLWSCLYCGVSSLWVGLYGWLVNVSCLGKLVTMFCWVELGFFSLECNEVSNNEL